MKIDRDAALHLIERDISLKTGWQSADPVLRRNWHQARARLELRHSNSSPDGHYRSYGNLVLDPASLRGQWLLVVVADGPCDERCESLLYMQRQLREGLGREKDRVDRVWFVTGNAPVRADLLPAMQRATVLYAPGAALAQWLAPAAGESLQNHLYLVDPIGRWMMRFPENAQPAKVKRDLERLLRASASWDQPGR